MIRKTMLIVKREYEARALSKAFLVLCIVLPVMLAAMLISTTINTKTREKESQQRSNVTTFQIIDEGHLLKAIPPQIGNIGFDSSSLDFSKSLTALKESRIDGIINIQDLSGTPFVRIYALGNLPESDVRAIQLNLQQSFSKQVANVTQTLRSSDSRENDLPITIVNVSETNEEVKSVKSRAVLGISLSVMVYFFIFFYGVRTLNAVVEEKMNRVSEIIISSVTPFELMIGKILGTTLAVLTQVVIVATVTILLTKAATVWTDTTAPPPANTTELSKATSSDQALLFDIFTVGEWVKIVAGFTVFFIVGFMLYAAIFAAIGASMEPNADTMQFVFPVLIPILFSLILVVTSALSDPENEVVWWASFIPFTSPVVMTMRLVYGVEWWELILSMLLLTATFLGITFIAGRIFRVGILLYGTKPGLKTIGKWIFTSE